MAIKTSHLDEKKNYIGMYLVNINKGKRIDAFKIILPDNISNLFSGYDNSKSFYIYNLNNVIQAQNENCYAHYQNKKNCKDGWIYILDNGDPTHISKCIDRIKYIVRSWMLLYKESIENDMQSSSKEISLEKKNAHFLLSQSDYIDDTIKQIEAKSCTIDVTLDSLSKNVTIEKTLYLFYLRELLSGKLQTSFGESVEVNDSSEVLNFYGVNLLHNDATLRLMTRMTRPVVDKKGVEYMYAYYVDITIQSYPGEKYPKLMIVPKSTRLRAESSIDKDLNYFKTTSANIYPYIFLPNTKRLSSLKQDGIFIQGSIVNSSKPHWDALFEKSFNCCFTTLPAIQDIFKSPRDYLYNEDSIDIYIPHGTHFLRATHRVGTGVDVLKRINIADSVHNILLKSEDNIEDNIIITNKIGTSKQVNSINTVSNNNFALLQRDTFEFDVLYISESFKDILLKFESMYNTWSFEALDLTIKAQESFKNACCSLRSILDGIRVAKAKELITTPNIKIKINFIHQRNDLDLDLNINKFAPADSDDRAKRKYKREIENRIAKNKQRIINNVKTSSNSCLVEVPSKAHYSITKQIDMKASLKHSLSSIGKVSQVINYYEKKNNYSWGAVIFKCITELLRLEGYLLSKPGDIVSKYESKYKIEDTGEKSIHVGICYIQSFKYISLVAIYKGLVYGLDTSNNSMMWVPINKSCCALGETVWTKDMIKDNYDRYYLEKALSSLYRQFTASGQDEVSHVFMYLDGSSLRKKMPFISYNNNENFNLLLCDTYADIQSTLSEKSIMPVELIKKMSISVIDGESSNRCPEWVEIKKSMVSPSGLPSALCQLNDYLFFSISEKTNTSNMSTNVKKNKDLNADLSFRKESAVMITVLKNKKDYPNALIAAYAHLLKSKVSIQYSGLSDADMVNPLPLDLAKKNHEHLYLKSDLILGNIDEYDDLIEEGDESEEDLVVGESNVNEQESFFSAFEDMFDFKF